MGEVRGLPLEEQEEDTCDRTCPHLGIGRYYPEDKVRCRLSGDDAGR